MNRHELLKRNHERASEERKRSIQEACVIEALPEGVEVEKAYTTTEQVRNSRAAAHGVYEVECATYADLRPWLEVFPPCEMARVSMKRDGWANNSISYYPMARVPQKWHESKDVLIKQVEPAIWHAQPSGTARGIAHSVAQAAVVVEWYTLLRGNYFVNVRVRIIGHSVHYAAQRNAAQRNGRDLTEWKIFNAPTGQLSRTVLAAGGLGPPYATVYWDLSCFSDEYTVADHLEGRATQNV